MPRDGHLGRLDRWKGRKDPDRSLSFLVGQFKREVERPYKQVGKLVSLWEQLVPAELAAHTKLSGFSRGVLSVTVDSSARLYELDQLLRGGVEKELVKLSKTTLTKVRLRVGIVVSGQ
jgi:predicted nucleic acid-binding Zn ribbon protein